MTPEEFETLRAVFLDAAELAPQARDSFLGQACQGRAGLRNEVQKLLAEDEDEDGLPVREEADRGVMWRALPLDWQHACAGIPKRLGPYRIIRVLGFGGMAVVYEAEQERPRRKVALKVLRPELTTKRLLARFEHEAELLGRLHHAGIAQIHEAGTAEGAEGTQPFFAMELVEGVPVSRYVEDHHLNTVARLDLFLGICDAVAYAHQRGIIHRDLKPANILATPEGNTKILDFGVARTTDSDLRTTTLKTDVGQLIGTLSYMSPEQCSEGRIDLDTRSDIYALGVLLYELLTGDLPHNLLGKSIPQSIRAIREIPVAPPSTHDIRLKGDLSTIVLKALEKEPDRRYQTVTALADDLRRYLKNEPIMARPTTAFYQIRKFAARHKLSCAVATAVVVLILAFSVAMAVLYRRCEREATTANAVTSLLTEAITAAAADRGKGKDYTVRQLLDDFDLELGHQLGNQPEVEARLHTAMAGVYAGLGAYEKSERHAHAALELISKGAGTGGLALAQQLHQLGWAWHNMHKYEAAEPLFRECYAIRRRVLGIHHPVVADAQVNLADILGHLNQNDEAKRLSQQAIATLDAAGVVQTPYAGLARIVYGSLLHKTGEYVEAEKRLRQAMRILKPLKKEEMLFALASRELGDVLVDLKKYDEAEEVLKPVLQTYLAEYPTGHSYIAHTRTLIGRARTGLNRFEDAERILLRAINEIDSASKPGRQGLQEAQHALARLTRIRNRSEGATRDLIAPLEKETGLAPEYTGVLKAR